MTQHNTSLDTPLIALSAVGFTVSPDAAIGALFGALFFWAMNPDMKADVKFPLLLASFGAGYAFGVPWGPGGWEMACAVSGATLGHVVFDSLRSTVKFGTPVPAWLKEVLNLLPWRRGSQE